MCFIGENLKLDQTPPTKAGRSFSIDDDVFSLLRHRCTTEDRNLKYNTGTHASTNTARDDFKQAMLANAANDEDRLIRNSVCSKSTGSTKGGQEAGTSARRPRSWDGI